ncbi:MAG: 50S ribosomal protein L25 [Planctomycetaceae bacterium]|jgi:large subunit ribosomal protein L25|nr:50S ribosomal protein L25 [Planctomycetaceae bacterium]
MAKVQTLSVKLRDSYGKKRNKRLRNNGNVPAVLYGHKQAVQSLTLSADEIEIVVRHGNRFVELIGDISEKAFIKEVQWNTWGNQILHVDFARASEHEKIHVTVPLELRGEAPGTKEGGVIKHVLHQIELECEAASLPEHILVNINHLAFNQSIHVSDLELPQGVKSLLDPSTLIVTCALPIEVSEEETKSADSAEPEIIGRKKTEEEVSE